MWRNWQTRRFQVPVGLARGGSTPLIRIRGVIVHIAGVNLGFFSNLRLIFYHFDIQRSTFNIGVIKPFCPVSRAKEAKIPSI
jgi:hypothetical protein